MTTYRLFPSTNGPSAAISYSGNFVSGVAFAVKGGGNWFNGYYLWVANTIAPTSAVKCALWSVTQATTGEVVSGSVVTSGTLTAGQWNFIPLSTPIQLAPSYDANQSTNGSCYIAAIGVNGSFSDTLSMFNSGDVYGSGITDGPLVAYSGNTGTIKPPFVSGQGLFTVSGTDPSVVMPDTVDGSGDGGSNFWVDVQVSDIPPAGYSGSYRLWPNKADSNSNTIGDAAFNYTIATEIKLTAPCSLNNIWYFSPIAATTLATRCDVWNVATGLSVASITSPAWLTDAGSSYTAGSSAAGSKGTWIKAAFANGLTLPIGDYRVSVYNSNGSTDANWGPKDAATDYFGQTFTGVGSSGITFGPLSAPNYSGASSGYVFGGAGTDTPPWSSGGTTTAHAQPVFYEGSAGATGVVGFPQLYAVVGAGNNQSQNYWVDLEVTPLVVPTEIRQINPGPTWLRHFKPGLARPLPVNLDEPGPITVAPGLTPNDSVTALTGLVTEIMAGIAVQDTVTSQLGTLTETITGLSVNVSVASPTGAVTEIMAGITATVNVSAPLGTVTTGMVIPTGTVSVTSATGTVTETMAGITGLVNTAALIGFVPPNGQTATVVVSAPLGSAQITIPGTPTPNIPVNAFTGSVQETVTGILATETTAAPLGIFTLAVSGLLPSVVISAPSGFASFPVIIQGTTAQVTVTAPIGIAQVPASFIVAKWRGRLTRYGVGGKLFG